MTSTPTSRVRRWWTKEEDQILRREADIQLSKGSLKDWNSIAAKLPGRTNKDCRKRWNKVSEHVTKGAWSSAEDERLQAAVERYGYRWTLVAQSVGTRHADQCAKRWHHSLDPSIDHSEWTPEEDNRLMAAVGIYGRNWKTIGNMEFLSRSATDIKNRHAIIDRKRRQASLPEVPLTAAIAPMTSNPDFDSDNDSDSEMEALDNFSMEGDFDSGFRISDTQTSGETSSTYTPPSLVSAEDARMALHSTPGPEALFPANTEDYFQQFTSSSFPWHDDSMVCDPKWSSAITLSEHVHPNQLASSAISTEDAKTLDDNPTSQTTLILEDVQPDTLNSMLSTLLKSRTRFKMNIRSTHDQ